MSQKLVLGVRIGAHFNIPDMRAIVTAAAVAILFLRNSLPNYQGAEMRVKFFTEINEDIAFLEFRKL